MGSEVNTTMGWPNVKVEREATDEEKKRVEPVRQGRGLSHC